MEQSGKGYLKVRVTSVGEALPVKDALVVIREYKNDDEGDVLYSLRTDIGGLTETVALSAPPAGDSLKPGGVKPYATYNIYVTKDGYYTVENVAVPVFENIVAVQSVNMIPLTEEDGIAGGSNGQIIIYETPEAESLQPGGLQREDIGNKNGQISGKPQAEQGGESK